MAITMTYVNPRKTHCQVVCATGTDTIGTIIGPMTTTVPCDGSSPNWTAIIGGAGGGVAAIVNPFVNQTLSPLPPPK